MHSLVILFIYTTSIWCFYVYVKLLLVKSMYIHVVLECIIFIYLYCHHFIYIYMDVLSEINYQSITLF